MLESEFRWNTGIGESRLIAPRMVSGDGRLFVRVKSGNDEVTLAVRSPKARLVPEKSIEALASDVWRERKLSVCERTSESATLLRPSFALINSFTASAMPLLSK